MLLQFLDYIGVAVFALTGAIVASRKGLDGLAFLFFATMTGIGGGTLRDLLLGVPVFWTLDDGYLMVCAGMSALMWFAGPLVERLGKPLRWADAIGMAAYCVMGAAKAFAVTQSAMVAILMGTMTATFGGVLRDIVAGEKNSFLKPEIYVSAALAGSALYVGLRMAEMDSWVAAGLAASFALILRGGAIVADWSLPGYKSTVDK
ncbi:trimeric intracellular cation channel family protein [Roseibium sp. CAU 1637]|uniref:Trimeric intracellular cation channel family protein n=1 Tax=Roseibium limicola TaxID=2816037 RepID=A0A939JAJ9_9HYPH|nr:trimeric intracellular cation channel family protein [Roseibium limicola]MBO0346508.1 trimeric intracellular cation channel family protein [Roseibium limicola]